MNKTLFHSKTFKIFKGSQDSSTSTKTVMQYFQLEQTGRSWFLILLSIARYFDLRKSRAKALE